MDKSSTKTPICTETSVPGLAATRRHDLTEAQRAVLEGKPQPLRLLVAEGSDGVVRALRARTKDAEAGR